MPDAIPDVRYSSDRTFIGDRIRGYERPAFLPAMEAANALTVLRTARPVHLP